MTTKKTTSKKSVKNMSNNNETKVMCPVCGTEFAIGEHEHAIKNGIAIGKDSGMGTVYLPVSKRGEALKAAGIDTSKYFSINLPTGGEQLMKIDEDGKAVPVDADDPIMQAIYAQGTVPNRNLFRRWIMSQMFHALIAGDGSVTGWINRHGYDYQWKMLLEEMRVQAKLYGKDMTNFEARNRWFDKNVCIEVARNFISQLEEDINSRKRRHCKGVPYIRFGSQNIFEEDIQKVLLRPVEYKLADIRRAETPKELYEALYKFWRNMPRGYSKDYTQCMAWKDAYKGVGAYFTMQNLLRFHGCRFPKDNAFYDPRRTPLQMLDDAADSYNPDEGWRMIGLLKQMLDENGIDIQRKMKEWAKAKRK